MTVPHEGYQGFMYKLEINDVSITSKLITHQSKHLMFCNKLYLNMSKYVDKLLVVKGVTVY